MIRLILFLSSLALSSAIAMWFIENDGSITLEWMGYRIQTSVAFAALAIIVTIAVIVMVLQILIWIKQSPMRFWQNSREKKRDGGLTALTKGFAAIAAGDVKEARKLTRRAISSLGPIPITKLLSAQTAQLEGNLEMAKIHYTSMLEDKETELIAIKGLLIQAKNEGDVSKAMYLAEKALAIKPDAKWALTILLDIYKRTGKWIEAENIIGKVRKNNVISENDVNRTLAIISYAKGKKAKINNEEDLALKYYREAYKLLPEFIPIVTTYAKALIANDDKRKAAKILEDAWKTGPHPDIADIYINILSGSGSGARENRAEKLALIMPNHYESHIILAKSALEREDSPKARTYLKLALAIVESRTVCKLMADLERMDKSSKETIQNWINRAERADPDPVWLCRACGTIAKEWTVNCGSCGSFDTLYWADGTLNKAIPIPTATELLESYNH